MQDLERGLEVQTKTASSQAPLSPVSRRKSPSDFCDLLVQGEDFCEQQWVLRKVVHMPQDRDILFIVWRRKQEYEKSCYSPVNERHAFEAMREWKRTLIQCQAWYFSILLQEGAFSKVELQNKIEPFLSQDGGRHLLAPSMLSKGKRTIAGDKLSSFPISEQAAYFVEHVADNKSNELEAQARSSGSVYVGDFINTVKRFFFERLSASPRSPFVEDNRPSLPEIKWPLGTVSREKRRKDCGPDDISSQEEWIADVLMKRKHFRDALTPLDTPKERASLLGVYSRNQLCGILVAFFSYSKEPVGDRMLNVTLDKHGLARIASEVLIIDEATHIHCLNIRNFLTSDELTRYVKSRAASGDLVVQQRELFEAYRDSERYTSRAFWNKKAHGAARRQLASDHPSQEKIDELTWLFEEIFRQQDGECLYCCAALRISKGKAWNNASPDRRVSAKKGGEYTKGNIDILCVGCQFCKWWYKPSEFRVLLLAIADAQWHVEQNLLYSSKPRLRVPFSKSDLENLVGPWCKKMVSAMQERKECEMTFDDVMTLLQDKWMGNGLLVDEAGVIAPLGTFSIDRLDSSIGYKNRNVRLLLWGLNSLKGDDKDDLTVIKYLQHLRTSQRQIQVEVNKLQKHEIRLPHQQQLLLVREESALICPKDSFR